MSAVSTNARLDHAIHALDTPIQSAALPLSASNTVLALAGSPMEVSHLSVYHDAAGGASLAVRFAIVRGGVASNTVANFVSNSTNPAFGNWLGAAVPLDANPLTHKVVSLTGLTTAQERLRPGDRLVAVVTGTIGSPVHITVSWAFKAPT